MGKEMNWRWKGRAKKMEAEQWPKKVINGLVPSAVRDVGP